MENKSLKIFVEEAIRAAMKKGEKERTITLRMLLHEIKTSEKIKKSSLDGSEISLITQKMIKQRKDSRSQFLSAGRDELAQKEEREIKTLSDFLPEQLSKEEIEELITKTIIELNAESPQDMGKVMGFLKPELQGKVDMSLVSKLVKEKLTK
ncbi:MAG: GatB/YqeY domain-containing protein [Pseudomonadota bacterium]|nr:GatB/YqeY domain-containing protein [Pseudomonadota bacterium]